MRTRRISLALIIAIGLATQGCGSGCEASAGSGPPPAPELSLSANPTTVPQGVASTLTWTASNATSCEASGDWSGSRPVNGSASTGPLTEQGTFELSCNGPGGSVSQTVTVVVDGTAQPPTVSLTATPSSTSVGASVSLSWTSTDTASCTASAGWSGDRPPSGTEPTGSLSATTEFVLDCTGPAGSARSTVVVEVVPRSSAVFPLSIAPDQRHLIDEQGAPFLINGDTPWSLMVALADAQITQYLDDRQARGFNTILVNLIEHRFTENPPENAEGVAPFTTPEDIRTPDDAYFDRCVGIVQQALDRNLLVMMTPAYLGFGGGDEGWWQALAARRTSEVRDYGAYLGAKFAALPNVVWVMGGDYWDPQVVTRTRSLVTGLKSTGRADWLFTYHTGSGASSSDVVGDESWLDLNATYTYEDPSLVAKFEQDYGRTPTRPFFLFESRYEQEPDPPVSRLVLRSQAYWSVLTGGMGALFGNNPIWNFENNALYSFSGTWQSNLDSNGAQDRTRFEDFFRALGWSSLVPDRSDTVLTGGQGNGLNAAYAAKSADSTRVIVYTPSDKQLTIHMSELTGPNVAARWFEPSSASYTTIGTFPNTGSRSFDPPGSGDWVLVLESTP